MHVFGIYNNRPVALDKVTGIRCDITDTKQLMGILAQIRPDAVIHAAAAADPNFCQNNPELSRKINVDATAQIAAFCSTSDIPMAFTSSDLVFDGKNAPYNEVANVCPVSLYGEQKVEAERTIRSTCQKGIICRMPLMYGDAPAEAKSYIHPLIAALTGGKTLKLFTDEYRSTCAASDAACGILAVLDWELYETFHLGGPERLSRFEIGRYLALSLGVSPELIVPCLQKDIAMSAPRPPDVSFDNSKAVSRGFSPRKMSEVLPELDIIKKNLKSPTCIRQDIS